jgi:endonuclease/exonuclease/phosphatase family metal-dependent hydrolase
MTFNIRYDNPADGPDRWELRRDRVAGIIRENGVDIAGVQEALRGQIADLEERLRDYAWFGVGREDGRERGEFVPIFYRSGRFERLDRGTFWLSDRPETPGSRGWDASMPRTVTWLRLKDCRTGGPLLAVNAHFDQRGVKARTHSARRLLDWIAEHVGDGPVVVTGDFNCVAASTPHRILTGQEGDGTRKDHRFALADARQASVTGHRGPDSTWNGFREIVPNRQIDFIFVGGPVEVRSHRILDERRDGRFASDHLPVVAEVVARESDRSAA